MQTTSRRASASSATPGRPLAIVAIASAIAMTLGCAGGSPLLHPAHTLRQGQSRFAAGTSGHFALGGASSALATARATQPQLVVDRPPADYIRGALVAAAIAPGMAPFVSGRVGVGYDAEAGLSYTGRTARIDGRYALQMGSLALSIGLGGSAILGHREGTTSVQLDRLGLDGLSGWGADVPILFGWRATGDVFWWWLGVRAGYESLRGSVSYEVPSMAIGDSGSSVTGDASGRRIWGGALTGIAVGFRHVHAGIELQGAYHDMRGTLWGTDVAVNGLSLTPAAALMGAF